MRYIRPIHRGFTLIEMLVSLSLFTMVAVIAVGTLLSLLGNNTQVVGDEEVMTSLSFALDSMTREIRTGSEYYCIAGATIASTSYDATQVRDCTGAPSGFSFREAGESITGGADNSRIAYYLDSNKIIRKVGDSTYESMLSKDIKVTGLRFFVTGTTPLGQTSTNIAQPTVTIVIDAQAASGTNQRPFTVETTVTQRPLDI
jgi:prepilin-type N-terminal cleavage/methylation domain-containing protein